MSYGPGESGEHEMDTLVVSPKEIRGANEGIKKPTPEAINYQKMQSGIELAPDLAEGAQQEMSPAEKMAAKEKALADRKQAQSRAARNARRDEENRQHARAAAEKAASTFEKGFAIGSPEDIADLKAALQFGTSNSETRRRLDLYKFTYDQVKKGGAADMKEYFVAQKIFGKEEPPKAEKKSLFSRIFKRG